MTVTMWKAPARREYKPKAMDPGQDIVWTAVTRGKWDTPPAYDRETDVYNEGIGWTDPVSTERIGVIWSDGSSPNSWWVLPDDDTLNPVLVRRAGKRRSSEYAPGELFEDSAGDVWRMRIRRAENVRTRGIFPVIESTEQGRYDYCSRSTRPDTHTVVWHADPGCPDAAGKEQFAGDYARGYTTYGGSVWTPGELALVLMGLKQIGCSPTPFCARCIMLDTSLRSAHSCASVTA